MIRNNLLALLIHTFLGAVIFISSSLLFEYASVWSVILALVALYLLYFILSFLMARLHVFNRKRKKIYHVLLPSIVMLGVIITLYALKFQSNSAFFGDVVGLLGQPVEFILAVTGDKLRSGLAVAGVIFQCLLPTPLIWLGLVTGSKGKLDGV